MSLLELSWITVGHLSGLSDGEVNTWPEQDHLPETQLLPTEKCWNIVNIYSKLKGESFGYRLASFIYLSAYLSIWLYVFTFMAVSVSIFHLSLCLYVFCLCMYTSSCWKYLVVT